MKPLGYWWRRGPKPGLPYHVARWEIDEDGALTFTAACGGRVLPLREEVDVTKLVLQPTARAALDMADASQRRGACSRCVARVREYGP